MNNIEELAREVADKECGINELALPEMVGMIRRDSCWKYSYRAALETAKRMDDSWIRVEDRLPEEFSAEYSQWVLISNDFDGQRFVCQDKFDFAKGSWAMSVKVTHWMPLPAPPKEPDHG